MGDLIGYLLRYSVMEVRIISLFWEKKLIECSLILKIIIMMALNISSIMLLHMKHITL